MGHPVEILRCGQVARQGKDHGRVAGNGTAQVVSGHPIAVAAEILPHGQFLEAEGAEGGLVQHLPARQVTHAVLHLAEIASAPGRVVEIGRLLRHRQSQAEVVGKQVRQGVVGQDVVFLRPQLPRASTLSRSRRTGTSSSGERTSVSLSGDSNQRSKPKAT